MIYRVLHNLGTGKGIIQAGTIIATGNKIGLQSIPEPVANKLADLGHIAKVTPPPLAVVPGWKIRAEKLAKAGITDAITFLEMPNDGLAQLIKVKAELIAQWKTELVGWLTVPRPKG